MIPTQTEIYRTFFSKPLIYFVHRNLPEKCDVNPSILDTFLIFVASTIFLRGTVSPRSLQGHGKVTERSLPTETPKAFAFKVSKCYTFAKREGESLPAVEEDDESTSSGTSARDCMGTLA